MNILELLPWIVIGVASGIFIGAIPGLTGAMVIALTVPLTFAMDQDAALALLVSLYTASVSGGLISATLPEYSRNTGRDDHHSRRMSNDTAR